MKEFNSPDYGRKWKQLNISIYREIRDKLLNSSSGKSSFLPTVEGNEKI
jgi:hypothetical protein